MVVCLLLGVVMLFRHTIRQFFGENLETPTAIDLAWRVPFHKTYEKKVLLELHYFNPRVPSEMIVEKLNELRSKKLGVHTVLLSGSTKIGTNTYIREIAKEDWGIQEIRLHSTDAINIYAFLNLIQSANSSLKRVLIWNSRWSAEILDRIRAVMPESGVLSLIDD
jgi:hypothetical protein